MYSQNGNDMVSQIISDGYRSAQMAGQRIQNTKDLSKNFEDMMVKRRMNQIMGHYANNGNSFEGMDPSLMNDWVGMEAMGKVSASIANTGEMQDKIFKNALTNADHQWKVSNQYMMDFDKAVRDPERQGDAMNLLISMGNSMGIPYRYAPGENGKIKVVHTTPDGDQDMGEMSLVDAYKTAKQYMTSQPQFVRNSVMHSMAMADINAGIQAGGASKWLTGIDPRTGRQVIAMPQYNLQTGAIEYITNGGRRITAEQLASSGIQWGTAAQTSKLGLRGIVGGGRSVGGGGGGGGGRRGGRQATPGQVTAAYNREFNQGMADLGYRKVKGQWVDANDMPVDTKNDEDFIAAAEQAHAQTVEILASQGYDSSGYRPRYGSSAPASAEPNTNSATPPAGKPTPAKSEASEVLRILLDDFNKSKGAK